MSFNIIGTGSCLPELVMTNNDLSKFLDTSDEWIKTRTGIEERHILKDETLLDLATNASLSALENAGVNPNEIDMIICSTLRGDYISPSLSCLVSKNIGTSCGRMFDMNMGCSGFLYALDMANAFFESNKVKKVLIVCAEAMSRLVDWEDRSTCVLFGDGAGAVVLGEGDGFGSIHLSIDGSMENLNVPSEMGNFPYNDKKTKSYLHMVGKEIYKFAVSSIVSDIKYILSKDGLRAEDVSYYLLHQANMRIIESAKSKLLVGSEKFPCNMNRVGNTSSASIPILLDEINKRGKLKKGMNLVFSAFGAGLSTGVCTIKW